MLDKMINDMNETLKVMGYPERNIILDAVLQTVGTNMPMNETIVIDDCLRNILLQQIEQNILTVHQEITQPLYYIGEFMDDEPEESKELKAHRLQKERHCKRRKNTRHIIKRTKQMIEGESSWECGLVITKSGAIRSKAKPQHTVPYNAKPQIKRWSRSDMLNALNELEEDLTQDQIEAELAYEEELAEIREMEMAEEEARLNREAEEAYYSHLSPYDEDNWMDYGYEHESVQDDYATVLVATIQERISYGVGDQTRIVGMFKGRPSPFELETAIVAAKVRMMEEFSFLYLRDISVRAHTIPFGTMCSTKVSSTYYEE